MAKDDYEWVQPSMYEGGYTTMTVEITVHLDGPTGRAEVWLTIMETGTRRLIRMETAAHCSMDTVYAEGARALGKALKDAKDRLAPF